MKNLFFLLLTAISLIACSNNDDNSTDDGGDGGPSAGTADITLTAGGEQYKINGSCDWASTMGTNYIGANDSANNLKTFSAFFNIELPPSQTTTYTLVKDAADTDPTHITMNISEIRNGGLFEYTSDGNSGTVTLVVVGNKITVDLAGIILQPTTESMFYEVLNVGAFANPGTLSGTLEFYRN